MGLTPELLSQWLIQFTSSKSVEISKKASFFFKIVLKIWKCNTYQSLQIHGSIIKAQRAYSKPAKVSLQCMMVESVLEEEEVVYYNYSQKSSRNSTFSCIAMAYSITFYKNHSIDKDGAGDVIIIFLKKLAVS